MAALIFTLCACQPSGDDIVLELIKEDPNALLYTFEHQKVNLGLACNRSWRASCYEDWIELETVKGSDGEGQWFTFTLASNPEYSYRTGEIVIKAGDKDLVLTVTQEPDFWYLVKENFDSRNLVLEEDLPSGWSTYDYDGDGFKWRCFRDPETEETFAYSASYDEYDGEMTPYNIMVSPSFNAPSKDFFVKWDCRASDADYTGDKYKVYIAQEGDFMHPIISSAVLCEEVTTSATELTHHVYSLEQFEGIDLCLVFVHFDSKGLSRVLITNVEVSNKR